MYPSHFDLLHVALIIKLVYFRVRYTRVSFQSISTKKTCSLDISLKKHDTGSGGDRSNPCDDSPSRKNTVSIAVFKLYSMSSIDTDSCQRSVFVSHWSKKILSSYVSIQHIKSKNISSHYTVYTFTDTQEIQQKSAVS